MVGGWIRAEEGCEGGGNCLKYLKRGWNRKEGKINKDFKKEGQAGPRGGCFKKGGLEPPYKLCACDLKLLWNKQLTEPLRTKLTKWSESLPQKFKICRSIPTFQDEILSLVLHVFGNASLKGVSAVLYGVVHQKDGRSQGILAAKSVLLKQTLTVPHLELVIVHMVTNLMENTRSALKKYFADCCYAWTDSTVVLCWLKIKHGYKQFVTNRILKINEKN